MEYLIREDFLVKKGFEFNSSHVLDSIIDLNEFLTSLPPALFKSIDYKTTGSLIGAVFCGYLADNIEGAIVNPIEKGYPDIIPEDGENASKTLLRNYPNGIEVKGTIGSVTTGANMQAGETRISKLTGITWQAHHRQANNIVGIIWDFANHVDGFNIPAITGVFFTENLEVEDWGKISGTTGRNTKVSGMLKSGKEKMGEGWILLYKDKNYLERYSEILGIDDLVQAELF